MAVIKNKEKFVKKPIKMAMKSTPANVRKKLKRPQDNQPIATVCAGG